MTKFSRPFRAVVLIVVSLLAAASLAACKPGQYSEFTFLKEIDGEPVQQIGCTVRYRINTANYSQHAPGSRQYVIDAVRGQADVMTYLTAGRIRFVYEGQTSATYESQSGQSYVADGGVIVEFREFRALGWSQPKLDPSGRYWKGGVLWMNMDPTVPKAAFESVLGHEWAHQLGLGDNNGPNANSWSKMNNSGAEWTEGDLDGIGYLTTRARALGCG